MVADRLLEVGSWQNGQRIIATATPWTVKAKDAFRPKKAFACEIMARKANKANPLDSSLTKIASRYLAESLHAAPEGEDSACGATSAFRDNAELTSLLVEYRAAEDVVVGMLQKTDERIQMWTHSWELVERCLLAEPFSLAPEGSDRIALKACKKDLQNLPSNVLEQLIQMKRKIALNRKNVGRPRHKNRGHKISAVDRPRSPVGPVPLPLEQRNIIPVPVKAVSFSENVGPTLSQMSVGQTLSQVSSTSFPDSKVLPSVSASSIGSATSQKARGRLSPADTQNSKPRPFGMKLQTPRPVPQSVGAKNGENSGVGKTESRLHRQRITEVASFEIQTEVKQGLIEHAARQLKKQGPGKKDGTGAHTIANDTPAANRRVHNAQETRRPHFRLLGGPFGPAEDERAIATDSLLPGLASHPTTLPSVAGAQQGGLTWQRSGSSIEEAGTSLAGPVDRSLLSPGAFEPWPARSPNTSGIPLDKILSPRNSPPKTGSQSKSSSRSRLDESAGSAGLTRNIILFETGGAQHSFEALLESDEDSDLEEVEDDEGFDSSFAQKVPGVVSPSLAGVEPQNGMEIRAPERAPFSPSSVEMTVRRENSLGARLNGSVLSPTEMFLEYPIPNQQCLALGAITHRPMDDAVAVSRGLRGKNLARWGSRGAHQPRKPHLPPPPRQFGIAGLSVPGPHQTPSQRMVHAAYGGASAASAELEPGSGGPYTADIAPHHQPTVQQDNRPANTKSPQAMIPETYDRFPASNVRSPRAADNGPNHGVQRIFLLPRTSLRKELSGPMSPRHRRQILAPDPPGGRSPISPSASSARWPPLPSSTVEAEESLVVSQTPLLARPQSNRAPARQVSTPVSSPRPSVSRGTAGLDSSGTRASPHISLPASGAVGSSRSLRHGQVGPVVDTGRAASWGVRSGPQAGMGRAASDNGPGRVLLAEATDMLALGDVSGWPQTESAGGAGAAGPLAWADPDAEPQPCVLSDANME